MTNPEIIEKWRAEFKVLVNNQIPPRKEWFHPEDFDAYVVPLWEGFLMARESLVIRIPELYIIEHAYQDKEAGYNDCVDDCVEVIESQGYRVVSGAYDSNNPKLI